VTNTLAFGPIQFHPSSDWSGDQRQALQRLFSLTYPRFKHYLGEPVTPGPWQLEMLSDNDPARASCWGREQRLALRPLLPPSVIIHELGHVFHGERTTHFDFFSEGIAEALAELISQECRLQSPGQRDSYALGINCQLLRRTPFNRSHWNRFAFLLDVRTKAAAAAWKDAEHRRPGFLRTFHRHWQALPQIEIGPHKVADFAPAQLRAAVAQTEAEHHIDALSRHEAQSITYAHKLLPAGMQQCPILLAYAGPNKEYVYVCGAVLSSVNIAVPGLAEPQMFLAETINARVPVQVDVAGLMVGRTRRSLSDSFQTPADGSMALSVSDLRDKLGNFPTYRFVFRAPGALHEELMLQVRKA